MDIAFVTTRLIDHDAQGNFSAATLSALKARCGGTVTLYTFAYERPPVDGVEVRFLGGINRHGIGTNLRALLRTFQTAKELSTFDRLVLAGPDVGALPGVHLAKRRNPGMKLIWVYHGVTPPQQLASLRDRVLTRLRSHGYRWSMERSDLVKTDSQYTKDELIGRGIAPSKIVAIPIGIDLSMFSPGDGSMIRASFDIGDRFVLLYVGRLASGKRVDNLIRAMAMMKEIPVALIVVGGGPERERLEALAGELGVRDMVKFAGRVPDGQLPDYYRACDAWVTASEHEGFCVPVVEAMATGKPVIVPGITAMPETAGEAGLVYDASDPGNLVKVIEALMNDKGRYRSLAAQACRRALHFDMSAVMDRYLGLITSSCVKP